MIVSLIYAFYLPLIIRYYYYDYCSLSVPYFRVIKIEMLDQGWKF